MGFITPITNRVENDLKELEAFQSIGYQNLTEYQKSKWMLGMKGALNASDLNRIENNCMFLFSLISKMAPMPSYKTDWKMTDMIKTNDFVRIYRNLLDLMYPFGLSEETPSFPYDTISKLNKVEELLNISYSKISPYIELSEFKTHEIEEFKTSTGESFKLTTNTYTSELKTNTSDVFKTSKNEKIIVFSN